MHLRRWVIAFAPARVIDRHLEVNKKQNRSGRRPGHRLALPHRRAGRSPAWRRENIGVSDHRWFAALLCLDMCPAVRAFVQCHPH